MVEVEKVLNVLEGIRKDSKEVNYMKTMCSIIPVQDLGADSLTTIHSEKQAL